MQTCRRASTILRRTAHHPTRYSSNVIVKSWPQFDMPELDPSFKHGPMPKFIMENFMKADRKEKVAFLDGHTKATRTFMELYANTYSLASELRTHYNIQKGEAVAIMSPNNINYFSCFQGTALTGGMSTTINPLYSKQEVLHQLNLTQAKVLIAHPMCLEVAQAAAEEKKIPLLLIEPKEGLALPNVEQMFGTDLGAIDEDSFLHSSTFDDEDLVTVPFSSGTTGVAKGVMLTHRNITANIYQIMALEGKYLLPEHSKNGKRGTLLCPLPFFHIYGMVAGMCIPAYTGAKLVSMSAFDLPLFLQLVQDEKVSRAHIVPPIALALAKHPIVDQYDLSSLETLMSGAAPLGGEVQKAAALRLGCLVKQAWGMTELSPAASVTPDELVGEINESNIDKIVGKSGVLTPATEGKIIDTETGADLPSTQEGELLIRGAQVMKGYLQNEEATAATITSDGWLKTGDVGKFTEDGWLILTDRIKELIKYKGFQVPPAELEALLLTHAAIKDAIVIPVLDDEAGELPRAYVVLQDGLAGSKNAPSEADIENFVAENVAPHKKLRGGVKFAESVPKSASGKLLRRTQIQMDRGEI